MAEPIIIFDASTGSETQASGCGPGDGITSGSAIHGTGGCTGATGETATRVGLTDAANLTGVAAGHALYLATGSTNRRFSKITAVSDAMAATTVASGGTVGSTAVTVASAAGISTGDIVRFTQYAGDGSGVEFHVVTVSGNVLSFTTGLTYLMSSGANVDRPRQVTVADNMLLGLGAGAGGQASVNVAIGGKRLSLDVTAGAESRRLFAADAKPGWTIRFGATADFDIGATTPMPVTVAGDTTTGRIIIEGDSAGARPVIKLTGTNVENMLELNAAHYVTIRHLTFRKEGTGTMTSQCAIKTVTAVSKGFHVDDCLFDAVGIGISTSVAAQVLIARRNTFKNCVVAGIFCQNSLTMPEWYLRGNLHYCTGTPATGQYGLKPGNYGVYVRMSNCIFYNLDCGVYGQGTTSSRVDEFSIEHCLFHTMLTSAIRTPAPAESAKIIESSNIYWNLNTGAAGGYAIDFTAGSAAVNDPIVRISEGSAFGYGYDSSTARVHNISDPASYVTIQGDPCVNAASLDFSLDNTASQGAACRAVAWPDAIPYPGSGRNNYGDLGALRHADPSGSAPVRIGSSLIR